MKKGFTLIELLVVIAVIAILAAIIFPVFAKAREKARQAACASNEKQIGLAISQYVQDNDEIMVPRNVSDGGPYDHVWTQIMQPYVKSQHVFQCPSNPRGGQSLCRQNPNGPTAYSSYAANVQGGFRDVGAAGNGPPFAYASYDAPAQVIAVVETTAHYCNYDVDFGPNTIFSTYNSDPRQDEGCLFAGHSGLSNYLFVDGHVKAMRPLATLDRADGGTGDVNLWRYDNDTFIHHQLLTGPAEPSPTRARVELQYSADLYK